ncbi:MAG: hypothetical protein ACK5XS_10210 [Armatimonadota bacterium]|jgi:hypothetical protein|nr:hypothetical protein [Fimbriimonadaceae bacterium]
MASVRIRGDYRFRAFINLLIFKIGYTKTGTVDRVYDLPGEGYYARALPLPGPFDILVSLNQSEIGEKPFARAVVHLDGIPDLKMFEWAQEIDVQTSVPVQVNDDRYGNHFHGVIEVKL